MKVEPTEGGNGVYVSVEVGHIFSLLRYLVVLFQSHPLPLAVTFSQYGASLNVVSKITS
jgi:hypothetical protein